MKEVEGNSVQDSLIVSIHNKHSNEILYWPYLSHYDNSITTYVFHDEAILQRHLQCDISDITQYW